MENEYPLMLYKDGDLLGEWVIVNDAAEEAAQAEAGYVRHDAKPAKKAKGA